MNASAILNPPLIAWHDTDQYTPEFINTVNYIKRGIDKLRALQPIRNYPKYFVESLERFMYICLYTITNTPLSNTTTGMDTVSSLIDMYPQSIWSNWFHLLDGNEDQNFIDKMDALYNLAQSNRIDGKFSASKIKAKLLEEKQQYALNAKHGHNKVNAKKTTAIKSVPFPSEISDIVFDPININRPRYYHSKTCEPLVDSPDHKKKSGNHQINGLFTWNFLSQTLSIVPNLVIIFHAATLAQNPPCFHATLEFTKHQHIQVLQLIWDSGYENGRRCCTIYFILPLTMMQNFGNVDDPTNLIQRNFHYLKNATYYDFLRRTDKSIPICTSENDVLLMHDIFIQYCRSLLNNRLPFESNSRISGPATNIASTRPLEGATDIKAMDVVYDVDTVSSATIFNCQFQTPEDKISI